MPVERNGSQSISFQVKITELPIALYSMLFFFSFAQINRRCIVCVKEIVSSQFSITDIFITKPIMIALCELLCPLVDTPQENSTPLEVIAVMDIEYVVVSNLAMKTRQQLILVRVELVLYILYFFGFAVDNDFGNFSKVLKVFNSSLR